MSQYISVNIRKDPQKCTKFSDDTETAGKKSERKFIGISYQNKISSASNCKKKIPIGLIAHYNSYGKKENNVFVYLIKIVDSKICKWLKRV